MRSIKYDVDLNAVTDRCRREKKLVSPHGLIKLSTVFCYLTYKQVALLPEGKANIEQVVNNGGPTERNMAYEDEDYVLQ
jgi:hypothetical protein